MKTETISQVAAVTPPTSVTGLLLLGYPVAEWVTALTLIYVVLMIVAQIPKATSAVKSIYRRLKHE